MTFESRDFSNSLFNVCQCFISGMIILATTIGCVDRVGAPVNIGLAQKTLTLAMESWKEGKSPKDLLARSPSVVVQETEWNDKTKLQDYEIINDNAQTGPNLVATVKLKLSNVDGKLTEKTATYIIGTSPSLTIYRNTMR